MVLTIRHPAIIYREEVRETDVESIRNLTESTGFFSSEEVGVAVELVRERLEKGPKSGYYFLFAETDQGILGYTCFGPIPATRSGYDLYWIAVQNLLRGQGIGKQLLERTETIIAARGGKHIYAETSSRPQYEPTRSFYRSSGYEIEAVLKDFYSPGEDKLIFRKCL